MIKNLVQLILLGIVLVLVQVVLSKVILFNVAVPFVFIYLIMRLPASLGKNWLFTIAFAVGLLVDIFNNTPGMNALACTVMAAFKHPVLNATAGRDNDMTTAIPSIETLGVGGYSRYASTLTIVYCLLIFFIQAFTLRDVVLTLLRVVASSALSFVMILAIDSLVSTRREKRL